LQTGSTMTIRWTLCDQMYLIWGQHESLLRQNFGSGSKFEHKAVVCVFASLWDVGTIMGAPMVALRRRPRGGWRQRMQNLDDIDSYDGGRGATSWDFFLFGGLLRDWRDGLMSASRLQAGQHRVLEPIASPCCRHGLESRRRHQTIAPITQETPKEKEISGGCPPPPIVWIDVVQVLHALPPSTPGATTKRDHWGAHNRANIPQRGEDTHNSFVFELWPWTEILS
jgi:hypothetical protein